MEGSPPVRRVPVWELRRLFNERGLFEAAQQGTLSIRLRTDKHPARPKAAEPVCTRSQAVDYLDDSGRIIAVVHQYLRRDGTIGASGRPDPKQLLHDGELLIPEQEG